ncbi:MAG: hypothetical protein ACREBR_05440 [bacterium]
MKKLLKDILTAKKNRVRIHDPIAELIARLSDPTDVLYDPKFVAKPEELDDNTESR